MEEVQIFIIVVMVLAIFWLTSGCRERNKQIVEGYAVRPTRRREGQPCNRVARCGPGLNCYNGVCIVPKGIDDPFDLKQ